MRPSERTTKRRKVFRKTPGGETKKVIKNKNKNKVNCAICKANLQATTTKKSSKTEKKPTRKFGGNLCHSCAKKTIKLEARLEDGSIKIEDIEPKFRRFVK